MFPLYLRGFFFSPPSELCSDTTPVGVLIGKCILLFDRLNILIMLFTSVHWDCVMYVCLFIACE